jgi:hypothetical protein
MMGGETARKIYSIDNNKEYCIRLHLVGCTGKNYIEVSNATINGTPKIQHTYIHFESLPSRIRTPFHIG